MNTRFEIVLHGENLVMLQSAGEAALDEIERLESQLSIFKPASEISRVNRYAATKPVPVSPPVFELLLQSRALTRETGGAFDITVAPLVKCWGFLGASGVLPRPDQVAEARAKVGMHRVQLDPENFTVRFEREGMMLDLGAIGKGYAVDCAVEVLREAGITSAFIHGGTSSVSALGHPPGAEAWVTTLPRPIESSLEPRGNHPTEAGDFGLLSLREQSLGVSAVWGKSFKSGTVSYGHVIDPRSGQPVQRASLAAVVLPSATEADALSTALLALGEDGLGLLASLHPGLSALVAVRATSESGFRVVKLGL